MNIVLSQNVGEHIGEFQFNSITLINIYYK